MTNIQKISEQYNVQLHKADSISNLLQDYLPRSYAQNVKDHLIKNDKDSSKYDLQYIRRVKILEINNAIVFEAIVAVAQEFKNAIDRLQEAATSCQ